MKRDDPTEQSTRQASETGHGQSQESHDLPESYGETKVVLMPVSPTKIHAFWDMPAGDQDQQDAQTVLRFHEAGDPAASSDQGDAFFDVNVDPHAKSMYVDIEEPGKSYQAEFGFASAEDRFVSEVESNIAETPRPRPAPETTSHDRATVEHAPAPFFEPPPQPEIHHHADHWHAEESHPPAAWIAPPPDGFPEPFRDHPPAGIAPSNGGFSEPFQSHRAADPSTEDFPTTRPSPETFAQHPPIAEEIPSARVGTPSAVEQEEHIIRRRLAVFNHLTRLPTMYPAESEALADRPASIDQPQDVDQPLGVDRPRGTDLTEMNEKKFVAGISS